MNKLKLTAFALGISLVLGACSNEPDPAALASAREAAVAEFQAQEKARLEENKNLVRAFFAPGATEDARFALLHDDYIQHNPPFKKFADENNLTAKEAFKPMFAQLRAAFQAGGPPGGPAGAQQPPQGNTLHMLVAEDDLVFLMKQVYRQDPTKPPGNFYEAFTWDTFRIKDGKLYEHWDAWVIDADLRNIMR